MKSGIIQVYTGDGKGKTTAALGLALRAWGHGLRIVIYHFLKTAHSTGEEAALKALQPGIPEHYLWNGNFLINRAPNQEELEQVAADWKDISRAILSEAFDLVILDELSHALNTKLLALDEVLTTLKIKPAEVEVVLTGRAMPAPLLEIASLVTEMQQIKHPYQNGIRARKGIEY